MSVRWFAALVGLAISAACGGTEELALNPISTTSAGASSDIALPASGTGAGGSLGASGHGGGVASPSDDATGGGSPQAGAGPLACSGDLQCAEPTRRCSESGSCVACLSDDDCPLDGARRCDDRGRCVACRESEDCGDKQSCNALTGTCQACSGADCTGLGGSSEGGNP